MNNPQGFVFGLEKFGGFEIFEGHYFSLLFQLVLKTQFRNFGNSFMIMKICLNACTTTGALYGHVSHVVYECICLVAIIYPE